MKPKSTPTAGVPVCGTRSCADAATGAAAITPSTIAPEMTCLIMCASPCLTGILERSNGTPAPPDLCPHRVQRNTCWDRIECRDGRQPTHDRPLIDHQLSTRVTNVIQNVTVSVVMPSFRALRPEDIHAKDTPGDPEDLVTIVDKAAELALIEQLGGIVPGAVFVGEEGVCENPALLSALKSREQVWLIDPIDGTKNFARGHADFGV